MKYILTVVDPYNQINIEFFNNKAELLKFLKNEKWDILNTINLTNAEQYTNKDAEFIATKEDELGRRSEAYLRAVEG
jgi:hypothetical protein